MSADRKLKAAIVGLGQVGLLFDEEPERRSSGEVWTHFTAYERLAGLYDLVAAADPDLSRRAKAEERRPGMRTYPTAEAMLAAEDLDVVSVCTPDASHLGVVSGLLGRCRGIFLEKPLCSFAETTLAEGLARQARERGVSLRVNYYKRQEPLVREVLGLVSGQRIRNVQVKYSGPFTSVGSHAFNLMLLFAPTAKLDGAVRHVLEEGDGYSGFFSTPGGMLGQVLHCGPRHDLVFELELTTDRGRHCLERNLSCLRSYAYAPSARYQGYREMEFQKETNAGSNPRRFLDILEEIAVELATGSRNMDSLEHAFRTQALMSSIVTSATFRPE